MIIIGIIFYFVFGFVSLLLIHMYKRELGVDIYDPPHSVYYDDYKNNAQAFLTFAIMWPFFWLITLVKFLWETGEKISEVIGKKIGK